MAPPPDTILAFASGFPLVVLGAALLAMKPRRGAQLFFGAFAVLWGLQVILANAGRVLQDASLHQTALLASYACFVPASLFLVHFTAMARPPDPTDRLRWVPSFAMGAVALAAGAILVLDPALVVARVVAVDGVLFTAFGAAWFPLVIAPFYGAFFLAIVILAREHRRATPGTPRHRVRGMLLAFALFVSYVTARQVASFLLAGGASDAAAFASGGVTAANRLQGLAQGVFFLLGALLLAAVAGRLVLRPPPPEGIDAPLVLAFAVPAATAVAEAVFLQEGVPFETLGFWRLLTVSVIAYTLARHHLFDLDTNLGRLVGPGLAGILLVLGIPLALSLTSGGDSLGSILPAMAIEVVAVGATLFFSNNIRDALFPGGREPEVTGRDRRLGIYRAALEEALARGDPPNAPELRETRLRLGVPEREHELMVWLLRGESPTGGATAPLEAKVGSVLLGRYRLKRLLGRGTSGRTFLAADSVLRADVAVKVVETATLGGEAAKLLLREARLTASLLHPYILRVVDVAEMPGAVLLVTEYADRGNLADLLQKSGPVPLRDALKTLDEILQALAVMHARGVIHRNLKPHNLLLEEDGTVRVADFGAAAADSAAAGEDLEETARAHFSLLYVSPEVAGGGKATARSDLYVAAVIFHDLVSGGRSYLPITGKDDAGIRELLLRGDPVLHLPPEGAPLEPFLRQALAKDPAERFGSAEEMRAAFAGALRVSVAVA